MKKMITLVMTVLMALSAFTSAGAAVSDNVVDMDTNTAYVFIGEAEYYMEIVEASVEDGLIAAMFSDPTGSHALVVVMDEDVGFDCLEAAYETEDAFACLLVEDDYYYHTGVCSSEAYEAGYGVDLMMTIVDEDGRYQGVFAGITYCEENGAYTEVIGMFDFTLPGSNGGNRGSDGDLCSICDGTGMCTHCDFGMCEYCDFGDRECYCGFGDCTVCDGMGYFSYYDYEYGTEYRDCSACYGTGMHDYCNGTGFLDCSICSGTGECSVCYGTGECGYCYGTGRK